MLTAELVDWAESFGPRDETRAHVDLAGRDATYAQVLDQAPADALARIAPVELARRYAASRAAMARLRENIAAARLDSLIVIGDDQEELFDHTNMPAIGIWYGETIPNAKRPCSERRRSRIQKAHIPLIRFMGNWNDNDFFDVARSPHLGPRQLALSGRRNDGREETQQFKCIPH